MKILAAILFYLPVSLMAQQKCENLFADSSLKVLQELAQLRVNIETAPSINTADMIQKMYKTKYALAEKLKVDLSPLPQLVEDIRRQQSLKNKAEQERLHQVRRGEGELALLTPKTLGEPGYHAKFSRDGKRFVIADLTSLSVYDSQSLNLLRKIENINPRTMRPILSPDGKTVVASLSQDARESKIEVTLWNVDSGEEITALVGGIAENSTWVTGIDFTQNGSGLLIGYPHHSILWDLESIHLKRVNLIAGDGFWKTKFSGVKYEKINGDYGYPHLSPDGQSMAMIGKGHDPAIFIKSLNQNGKWKTRELTKMKTGGHGTLFFSPDGSKLINTWSRGDSVKVWNAKTGEFIDELKMNGVPFNSYEMDMSLDGKKIALVGFHRKGKTGAENEVVGGIWDLDTGNMDAVLLDPHKRAQFHIKFDASGSQVMTTGNSDDDRITVWRAMDGSRLYSIQAEAGNGGIASSPIETKFITNHGDKIKVWKPGD
jgi:WD40 repeat protein